MIFLDTNVFVYAAGESDYQPGASTVIRALGAGSVAATTSVTVLEELWHLELSGRIEGLSGVTRAAHTLVRPALAVTDEILAVALARGAVGRLGANDLLHVATCQAHGIAAIVTADRAFDAAHDLRRVDPGDLPAVVRLLAEPD